MDAVKQHPGHGAWWTFGVRGYRLTREGSAGLAALGIEQRAGTFVSGKRLRAVRDDWIASKRPIADNLAARYKAGDITITDWIMETRAELKSAHIAQYVLARGGLGNMTQADYGRIGAKLREQYGFLNDFAAKIIDNPQWSEAYIAARSQMYFEASGTSFEIGNQVSRGVLVLPQHPGDGRTQCLSNCKCYWDIRVQGANWECTWTLSPAEHCPDCLENAAKWAPLVVPRIEAATRASVRSLLEAMVA